jgi:hypothetical protein
MAIISKAFWEIGNMVLVDRSFQTKGKYYHSIYEAEVVDLSPNETYTKIKNLGSEKAYWISSDDIKEVIK